MPIRVQIKCTSQFKVNGNKLTLPVQTHLGCELECQCDSGIRRSGQSSTLVPDWLTFERCFHPAQHGCVWARFIPANDSTSMVFDATHRLTSESIYDWRDLAYAIADGVIS